MSKGIKKQTKTTSNKKECLKCKVPQIESKFYLSNSPSHADKRYPICKSCLLSDLNLLPEKEDMLSPEILEKVQNTLLELNRPFIYSLWLSSVDEQKRTKKELFGIYIKNVQLNFKTLNWKDSEFETKESAKNKQIDEEIKNEVVELDDKNKDDVLRMLGYDPFEGEAPDDKRHLYNKLVDMLDESTLEDGFKLPAVIEIVKGFNQIDKINRALAIITADTKNLSKNVGSVKSLIDSKEKMLKSLLALAKDNGISVNHNNNKSKGGGTLSGIIKTLQEKGFEEGEVNMYDIETAQGMRQVADISNKSIVAQLQFDENDYTSMIMEQRDMIQELDSKATRLEEENRLLKKELMRYKNGGDINEE
jgi:hypothetical protein